VIDDGSSDGTLEMVRSEFPTIIAERRNDSRGLIARRNEAAKLVTTDVIVSIDDDAEFSGPDIVAKTLLDFEDPRIAAVAIPFSNVRLSSAIYQRAPDTQSVWITNEYIGTAHAIRRDVFNHLGGYREALFHQHEEGDFCIRLLDAGYFVRLGHSEPVLHYLSTDRSNERMEVYGQRNLMLFAWYNIPMPSMLFHLAATICNGLRWGVQTKSLWHRCKGTVAGAVAIVHELRAREPVSNRTSALYRLLKKQGPLQLNEAQYVASNVSVDHAADTLNA
jgi:GT2 family glycosyltransferase